MQLKSMILCAVLSACTFKIDRGLNPGELRGKVVFVPTSGPAVPAIGAAVTLENSPVSVTTDGNGAFIIGNLPPGTFNVTITASSTGSGAPDSGLRLTGITLQPSGSALADGRDLGTITLEAFGNIAGTVTVGGMPATGALATIPGLSQAAVTDGNYGFANLPPGSYTLSVFDTEGMTAYASAPTTVQVLPRQTAQVPAIDLGPGTIVTMGSLSGQAQLTGTASSSGVGIELSSATPGVMLQSLSGLQTSDDQGDYQATELPPGIYTVTATIGGFLPASVPFMVVGGTTTTVPTMWLIPVSPSPTPPGAPTNVTAVAAAGGVIVTWTPPANTGGGLITAYTVTSSPGAVTATTTGAPMATVTGLTGGTSYTFTVVATNAAGAGPASTASAAVTALGVPGAPTSVAAVAGLGEATVTWAAPASNGGSAITGYTVTSSPGGITATTTGALTAAVTGLNDGTSYTFAVTATNAAGNSPPSAASAAVTTWAVPGAPSSVTAVPGVGNAAVTWKPADDGGSAVTGYLVTANPGGATAMTTGAVTATVSGLTAGSTYTFTVTATNAVGTGPASAASPSVTILNVPGAPTGVMATAANQQVALTWTAPASDGGSPITGYIVNGTGSDGTTPTGTSAQTSLTMTGLTNGVSYTFVVIAVNAVGLSVPSSTTVAVVPSGPALAPGAPTSVVATAEGGAASVTWMAPASNGGSLITGYSVTASNGGATANTTGALSATVNGLMAGVAYTFTVVATNAAGSGPASVASSAITIDAYCDATTMVACQTGQVCNVALTTTTTGCATPAYTVGAGTVTDPATGLVWQQSPTTMFYDWDSTGADTGSGQYYCAHLSLGGFASGWRLPTISELYSLVVPGSAPTIDQTSFPGTQSNDYWASTPVAGNSTLAWSVFFTLGVAQEGTVTGGNYVRCVH